MLIDKKVKIMLIIVVILGTVFALFHIFKVQNIIKRLYYKIDYTEYVEKYSNEYGLDKNLVYALIKAESNFNEKIVSNKGATGLMQIMEPTAKEMNEMINQTDLLNPETNIKFGVEYLSKLMNKYKQNYILAVAAYNAGMGNVDKWLSEGTIENDASNIENIPFKETNMYVRKIIRDYKIYEELYGM